jgi:hypothetical protein
MSELLKNFYGPDAFAKIKNHEAAEKAVKMFGIAERAASPGVCYRGLIQAAEAELKAFAA